ncbi:10936_t:CDS:2, partial [Funneliformis geosporum]
KQSDESDKKILDVLDEKKQNPSEYEIKALQLLNKLLTPSLLKKLTITNLTTILNDIHIQLLKIMINEDDNLSYFRIQSGHIHGDFNKDFGRDFNEDFGGR